MASSTSSTSKVAATNGGAAANAPLASARKQVHFPPKPLFDFVIHHGSTDYYTHKFVLHFHSEYFRAIVIAPKPRGGQVEEEEKVEGDAADGSRKRQRVTTGPSSAPLSAEEDRNLCSGHSSDVPCIHLPDQCGIAPSGEGDVLLFLQHLYFGSTLHSPPIEPKAESRATAVMEDLCTLVFPMGAASQEEMRTYPARNAEFEPLVSEPLLSLFHCFDCRQAMQRCEEVISASVLNHGQSSWYWLPLSHRYGLKVAETKCIEAAAKDDRVDLNNPRYVGYLNSLEKTTLVRLYAARVAASPLSSPRR